MAIIFGRRPHEEPGELVIGSLPFLPAVPSSANLGRKLAGNRRAGG
jgi:hypothetical protein